MPAVQPGLRGDCWALSTPGHTSAPVSGLPPFSMHGAPKSS